MSNFSGLPGAVLAAITCPISGEIMNDPVCCEDGRVYERANVEQWFRSLENERGFPAAGYYTSPITGERLSSCLLYQSLPIKGLRSAAIEARIVHLATDHVGSRGPVNGNALNGSSGASEVSDALKPLLVFSKSPIGSLVSLESDGSCASGAGTTSSSSWYDSVAICAQPMMRSGRNLSHAHGTTMKDCPVASSFIVRETSRDSSGFAIGFCPVHPLAFPGKDLQNFIDERCIFVDGNRWLHLPGEGAAQLLSGNFSPGSLAMGDRLTAVLVKRPEFRLVLLVNGHEVINTKLNSFSSNRADPFAFISLAGPIVQAEVVSPALHELDAYF